MRRGERKCFQKFGTNLLLTLFKDKKIIHMLSTNSQNEILASGKPAVVEKFNQNMGGVDLNDQLCSYYKAGRASRKWWRYLYWFMVNVAVTNAWILFKESGRGRNYTHVKFRMEVAEHLRGNFTSRKQRTQTSPPHLRLQRHNGHNLVRNKGG